MQVDAAPSPIELAERLTAYVLMLYRPGRK